MTQQTTEKSDTNQPPPLENYNAFISDVALSEAVTREGAAWAVPELTAFGELMGSAKWMRTGELANRNPPLLRTHDRSGDRIDQVEFHPAWHELLTLGVSHRHHSLPWVEPRPGAQVARAAFNMLRHQIDEGASCPLTMTFAAVPTLTLQPDVAEQWLPLALTNTYDQRFLPADQKRGALIGMALTERQGGSDVRSNRTFARALGQAGPGREYHLNGEKWFCSAPMSDAFLVLAQTEGGLSCFLAPRWRPDGEVNSIHFRRLKEKLGNRSNASSEVEFADAWARLVGEEGRGISVIMEMVRHTRLDCAFGSAATMRRAVAEAINHAGHRRAFGKRLSEQPLMMNVLADLALESEAATSMAMRLARGFDEAPFDGPARSFSRVATAIGKYWITKRTVAVTAEALECLGGNGYVEEGPMARLYRDAPLNSIWEGSGNVQCLDVLRVIRREPDTAQLFLAELRMARGGNADFDEFFDQLEKELGNVEGAESSARWLTERMALGMQSALLIRHSPSFVSNAFCRSRLSAIRVSLGTLGPDIDFKAIVERGYPHRL